MDRTVVLGWEIKSINGACVSTCVLLHICAHGGEGEEFIIRQISGHARGQASCFAVLVERYHRSACKKCNILCLMVQQCLACALNSLSRNTLNRTLPFLVIFLSSLPDSCFGCTARTVEVWHWFFRKWIWLKIWLKFRENSYHLQDVMLGWGGSYGNLNTLKKVRTQAYTHSHTRWHARRHTYRIRPWGLSCAAVSQLLELLVE